VRMVNHEREPSRYCANLGEHAHLFCSQCGSVTDLPVHTPVPPDQIWDLPEGITISQQEVSFRGICSQCSGTPQAPPRVLAPQSAPPSKPSSSPLAPARRLVP
jgi:Fur family peroxide stress response transcriptional regulator